MKRASLIVGGAAAAYLLLSIPDAVPSPGPAPTRGPFAWDADTLWRALEADFVRARGGGCDRAASAATTLQIDAFGTAMARFATQLDPADPALDSLEHRFFVLAPRVAACPGDGRLRAYVDAYERMRQAIKRQSRRWDLRSVSVRDRLYRALYGGRAAVEEVLLQHPESITPLLPGVNEPSATPGAVVHGVSIHSGDILVSRGGYPTSALIARGNDYPGNFSHVGLVYVDSATHAVSVIEAHIERGVSIATAEEYLAAKKLRIMVLRPRADLPHLVADPLLPHHAARRALERTRREHIPYDFTMDYTDPSHLFCSEVASWVYHDLGVDLWMGISTISSPGLRRWLASFGVRHFETQEPSDLEYDPQLVVVAEWRDAETLFRDHIDNAVIDAMLEGAERGDQLTYPWYALAPTRLAKLAGRHGPVPEGMSAAAALRNKAFSTRQRDIAGRVTGRAAQLAAEQGYRAPYWSLLAMAREEVGRH